MAAAALAFGSYFLAHETLNWCSEWAMPISDMSFDGVGTKVIAAAETAAVVGGLLILRARSLGACIAFWAAATWLSMHAAIWGHMIFLDNFPGFGGTSRVTKMAQALGSFSYLVSGVITLAITAPPFRKLVGLR